MDKRKKFDAIDRAIEALKRLRVEIDETNQVNFHDALQEVVDALINLQETVLPVKHKGNEQNRTDEHEGNTWDS